MTLSTPIALPEAPHGPVADDSFSSLSVSFSQRAKSARSSSAPGLVLTSPEVYRLAELPGFPLELPVDYSEELLATGCSIRHDVPNSLASDPPGIATPSRVILFLLVNTVLHGAHALLVLRSVGRDRDVTIPHRLIPIALAFCGCSLEQVLFF